MPTDVSHLARCALALVTLTACEPVEVAPPLPVRDTSYDADLDAPIPVVIRPDAPTLDTPRRDGASPDGGDPDFDAGNRLPIVIDGLLDEPEWLDGVVASQDRSDVGAFEGCRLDRLYLLYDDANIYFAVDSTLCRGSLLLFVDTGSAGVDLVLSGLSDDTGELDSAFSRPQALVDPDFRPSYGWGTSLVPATGSSAGDLIGWRELRQDSPHRHLTSDFTECSDATCETVVTRAALGNPSVLRFTLRIADQSDASFLALPPDGAADVSITTFATRSVAP